MELFGCYCHLIYGNKMNKTDNLENKEKKKKDEKLNNDDKIIYRDFIVDENGYFIFYKR